MSKVFEKLIHRDIYKHLTENRIINGRQHGFRKERSAADLHLLLSAKWSKALDKGLQTLVLALDIEGAFDRVWHQGLLAKLQSVGISGELLELIENYLSNRSLRVCISGKTSDLFPMRAGVPQGSVLGPLLWLIFINDALNIFPEADAFADDVTLSRTCEPKELASALASFNARLELLQKWGALWQVKFATGKTQFLIIWRTSVDGKLTFGHSAISNTNKIDILGLCYDKSLTYQSHITNIARRASGKIAALRRISWAVDQHSMEVLYKAQIRSTMEYAPLTWGAPAPTHLELLNKMHLDAEAERLLYGDLECPEGGEVQHIAPPTAVLQNVELVTLNST